MIAYFHTRSRNPVPPIFRARRVAREFPGRAVQPPVAMGRRQPVGLHGRRPRSVRQHLRCFVLGSCPDSAHANGVPFAPVLNSFGDFAAPFRKSLPAGRGSVSNVPSFYRPATYRAATYRAATVRERSPETDFPSSVNQHPIRAGCVEKRGRRAVTSAGGGCFAQFPPGSRGPVAASAGIQAASMQRARATSRAGPCTITRARPWRAVSS